MEKIIIFSLGAFFFTLSGWANFLPENISEIKEQYLAGKKQQSVQALEESLSSNKDEKLAGLHHFALGKIYFELGDDDKAQTHLSESLRTSDKYNDHVYFLMGQSLARQEKDSLAADKFVKVMHLKPRSHLYKEARFEFAKIAYRQKKYKKAWRHLRYLERRMRSYESYPEILWYFLNTDIKRGRNWHACRWARKLYRKYPYHELIQDWNIFLSEVSINKKELRCTTSLDQKKSRLRYFKLAGKIKRAEAEVEYFLSKEKDSFSRMYIQAYLEDLKGHPDEALKVLVPQYEKQKDSYRYLHLLAKVASKAGEYTLAVNAYYKAHKLVPRSRKGRLSLFQAAFLSYTFKDYDGAARKFNEFIKKYRRSGLIKDAKWHLAWIRYLKKDYAGAYYQFKKLRQRYRRFRYEDRVLYWQAMSSLKLEEKKRAANDFKKLADRKLISYYTVAAMQRLQELGDLDIDRKIASGLRVESLIEDNSTTTGVGEEAKDLKEEQETEESISKLEKIEEEAEEKVAEQTEDAEAINESDEEDQERELPTLMAKEQKSVPTLSIVAASGGFKNPYMQQRFVRAQEFKHLGFWDLARWDLYAIERKTRDQNYLRKLLAEYSEIEAFHRVSFIAQNRFVKERGKYGVEGAKYLWEYTYPRPYNNEVSSSASEFGLQPEFVWSIMRAESRYRTDARSPVGALGLMQMMPYTGDYIANFLQYKNFEPAQLLTPEVSVRFGTRYLMRLSKKFSGKIPLVAAGYNAGPHRVDGWLVKFGNHLEMDEFIEHIPYVETRKYVKKVVQNLAAYKKIYSPEKKFDVALNKKIDLKIKTTTFAREDWTTIY